MHIEVLEEIDVKPILQEANSIKLMLNKGWTKVGQIGLQSTKEENNWSKEWDQSTSDRSERPKFAETYYKYPLFDTPNINRMMEKYDMKRTRIMVSHAKSNLTFHRDLTKRIHIPLFTNENCVMIIEDTVYRLEVGKVYLTNTTLLHTAVNGSWNARAHIVGAVYS